MKFTLRARYYNRYVDDFVILDKNKEKLGRYLRYVDEYLHSFGLSLHPSKSKVMLLHGSVGFLGFRVLYHYKLLKEGSIRQIKRNLTAWKKQYAAKEVSYDKLGEKLQGWLAHASHGNTYLFRKRIVAAFNELFLLRKGIGGGAMVINLIFLQLPLYHSYLDNIYKSKRTFGINDLNKIKTPINITKPSPARTAHTKSKPHFLKPS